MESIFPLPPEITVAFSGVEFAAGLIKTMGGGGVFGSVIFYTFSIVEAACGLLLAVSILTSLSSLQFAYSRLLYIAAVVADLLFLILDILASHNMVKIKQAAKRDGVNFALPQALSVAGLLFSVTLLVLFFLPTLGLMIGTFGRLGWSTSAAVVTELTASDSQLNSSYRVCFAGFLLVASIVIFNLSSTVVSIIRRIRNDSGAPIPARIHSLIPTIIGGAIGAPLIASAGVSSDMKFTPGFALVALTAVPPFVAYLMICSKLYVMRFLESRKSRRDAANELGTQNKRDDHTEMDA